jgi:hypothetical protein
METLDPLGYNRTTSGADDSPLLVDFLSACLSRMSFCQASLSYFLCSRLGHVNDGYLARCILDTQNAARCHYPMLR